MFGVRQIHPRLTLCTAAFKELSAVFIAVGSCLG